MRIIRKRRIIVDPSRHVADDQPLPAIEHRDGKAIVSLTRWREQRERLLASGIALGLRIGNDVDVAELAADLKHLDLIALAFPVFTDGRAYSQARELRTRFAFDGELRATGDFLRDQLGFMARCGFDAWEFADTADLQDALAGFDDLSVDYQAILAGSAERPSPVLAN